MKQTFIQKIHRNELDMIKHLFSFSFQILLLTLFSCNNSEPDITLSDNPATIELIKLVE